MLARPLNPKLLPTCWATAKRWSGPFALVGQMRKFVDTSPIYSDATPCTVVMTGTGSVRQPQTTCCEALAMACVRGSWWRSALPFIRSISSPAQSSCRLLKERGRANSARPSVDQSWRPELRHIRIQRIQLGCPHKADLGYAIGHLDGHSVLQINIFVFRVTIWAMVKPHP